MREKQSKKMVCLCNADDWRTEEKRSRNSKSRCELFVEQFFLQSILIISPWKSSLLGSARIFQINFFSFFPQLLFPLHFNCLMESMQIFCSESEANFEVLKTNNIYTNINLWLKPFWFDSLEWLSVWDGNRLRFQLFYLTQMKQIVWIWKKIIIHRKQLIWKQIGTPNIVI